MKPDSPYGEPYAFAEIGNYGIELQFHSTTERDECLTYLRAEAKRKRAEKRTVMTVGEFVNGLVEGGGTNII